MSNQDTQSIGNLRPMVEQDLEMVLEWRNAPKVRENMYTQQIISLEEHQNWWIRVKDSEPEKYLVFEVGGVPTGFVSFVNFSPDLTIAEWGFYTAPTAPKGTGTRLGLCAVDYAFGALALTTLRAEVLNDNSASLDFHKKLGFQDEALLKAFKLVNGIETDVYKIEISANRWQEVRPQHLEKLLRRPRHV